MSHNNQKSDMDSSSKKKHKHKKKKEEKEIENSGNNMTILGDSDNQISNVELSSKKKRKRKKTEDDDHNKMATNNWNDDASQKSIVASPSKKKRRKKENPFETYESGISITNGYSLEAAEKLTKKDSGIGSLEMESSHLSSVDSPLEQSVSSSHKKKKKHKKHKHSDYSLDETYSQLNIPI